MATEKKKEFKECDATRDGFSCTLPVGHSGQHCAQLSDGRVCSTWGLVKRPTRNETLSMLAELVAVLDNSRDHNDDYSFHEPLSVRQACDKARDFL